MDPKKLVAEIWIEGAGGKRKSRGFLRWQETGGRKPGLRNHAIAVPTKRVPTLGSGKTSSRYFPSKLLEGAKMDRRRQVDVGKTKGAWAVWISTRNGNRQVFRRKKSPKVPGVRKKRIQNRDIQLWYNLEKTIRLRPRLGYEKTITRHVDQNFSRQLLKEINETIHHALLKRQRQTAAAV